MYLLQHGFGSYDLVKNNCEDFALYCKTGLMICGNPTTGSSGQVNAVFNALPWKINFDTVSTIGKIVSNVVVVAGGVVAVLKYAWNRCQTDIGVRDDVKKVNVEEAVEFRKRDIEPSIIT
ncbi:endopeptidase, NLPC/P60 domain, LRAT-like domain protein (chloroplast) [Artemisia annua]|uniref:Endopeptidase, NLPC/P60 domain, LRAT-like domain protein n=1 Tax=Artemisia annua TaxID=35608 RepID=A0A2U1N5Q1_ARTAN|nr:endopeptidase, NLPC/P60 domain, LRAT-like domain protein [Artemisia annua]